MEGPAFQCLSGPILNAWSHAKCDMIPFPLLTSALVPVRNGVKLCSLGELKVMPGSSVCVFTQLGKKISVKNGKKVVFVFCNCFFCVVSCFCFIPDSNYNLVTSQKRSHVAAF